MSMDNDPRDARASQWAYGPLRQSSERLLWDNGRPSEWMLVTAEMREEGARGPVGSIAIDAYILHDGGDRVPPGRGEPARVPRLLEVVGLARR